MTNDPLDLWPDDIQVAPLTPLRILQHQAQRLRERTNGLLNAEVVSATESGESEYVAPSGRQVTHKFEITAPKLGGYRYQMFECRHDAQHVYPVYLDGNGLDTEDEEAATQEELVIVLKRLFLSKRHRGTIASLLARIAETGSASVPA